MCLFIYLIETSAIVAEEAEQAHDNITDSGSDIFRFD